jgi:hypothetical protein
MTMRWLSMSVSLSAPRLRTRVGGHQRRPVFEIGNGREELLELGEAQNHGEFARPARIGEVLDGPLFAKGDTIQKSQGTDPGVERAPGQPLGEQVLLISTDVLRSE